MYRISKLLRDPFGFACSNIFRQPSQLPTDRLVGRITGGVSSRVLEWLPDPPWTICRYAAVEIGGGRVDRAGS